MYIIETEEQVEYFINKGYKHAFIHVVPFNNYIHPALNKMSLLYMSSNEEDYLISHAHNESLPLLYTSLTRILDSIDVLYTINKKDLFYYFSTKYNDKIIDLNFTNESIKINNDSKIYNWYYNKYSLNYLNTAIPLVKHYDYCKNIYNSIKHLIGKLPISYNEKAPLLFYEIEKQGIKITENIDKYFKFHNKKFSIKENKIFTSYNLYTQTKRPSNSFNNVNFLALNKTNGCKSAFVPNNDVFVEMDITAYHPTIISQLINYDFKGENIHEHFAKLYNSSYKEAKELTFKQIYGGVFSKYKDLLFFKKVQNLIDQIWTEYKIKGKFTTESGVEFKGEQLTDTKLFNYVIQERETYLNLDFIESINKILKDKKSKLILYVFDSFLIDLSLDEKEVITEIEKLFKNKNFEIKIKYKNNLE